MESRISPDVIDIIKFLLPGFLGIWVFYLLTPLRRNGQFTRFIEALMFTGFIVVLAPFGEQFLLWLGEFSWMPAGQWTENSPFLTALGCAALVGIVLAVFANHDFPQCILRQLHITREHSFPSEWCAVLKEESHRQVVLHLNDRRRLTGKLEHSPTYPDSGHFVVSAVKWLDETGQATTDNVHRIAVAAEEVCIVEFLKNEKELAAIQAAAQVAAPLA